MLDEGGIAPSYAHPNDAGMDFYTPEKITIYPGQRIILDSRVHLFIEPGFYLAAVPKSGLAAKFGLTIINSPGTIDADYTDSLKFILLNTGWKRIEFGVGDKIAQGILKEKIPVELIQVFEKPITLRGDGGLGSTGK